MIVLGQQKHVRCALVRIEGLLLTSWGQATVPKENSVSLLQLIVLSNYVST